MATNKHKSLAAKPSPKKKAVLKPVKKTVKPPVKKVVSKKTAPKKIVSEKPVKKVSVITKKTGKPAAKTTPAKKAPAVKAKPAASQPPVQLTPFLERQKGRLLVLKDTLLDSMNGVAKDSLRSRAEGSEASAFGMHQADAGSDAYDRDFALSLLSQEQDSLFEINQALRRIDFGTYGMCEMSGKPVPHPRLEALPFTRYTVECQTELEKRNRYQRVRQPVASLFGLSDEEGEGDEDDTISDSKDKE